MSEPESENDRQYRVIDQMLSAHSMLRDKYRRLGTSLSVSLLAVAIVLNAFVFTTDEVLIPLGVRPSVAKIILGLMAVFALVLSIVELKVDWSGRSKLHQEAASKLAALKLSFRAAHHKVKAGDMTEAGRLTEEYTETMRGLTPVPEGAFPILCARHKYKQMLVQRLRENPTCPVWILRLLLRSEGIWKAVGTGQGRMLERPAKSRH